MSFAKIWTLASNGFREVIRDRILYLIGLFALLLVLAWRILPQVAATTENKMIIDLGLAGINALGVIVAVFVGTGVVNQEIEKRTILVLVPKPISRAEFIIGKHLGVSLVLAVLVLVMTLIYLSFLTFSQVSYPLSSILVSLLFLFLQLSLIAAVGLLLGVFTSSLLAALLSFGIYLMGTLSPDLVELGNLSRNSNIKILTQGLYLVLPDLSRLNLKNEAVYGILPSPLTLLGNGFYGLFYIILLLAIAILVFSRREF